MEEYVLKKQLIYLMVLNVVISLLFLNACSIHENSLPPKSKTYSSKIPPSTAKTAIKWKTPIPIPDGEFFKVVGWLSNVQLLYIINNEHTSSLYSYHLETGKSALLYASNYPIGNVQISPERKYILIQAGKSSFDAIVTVIDTQGNNKYSQLIPSHELAFEWNPYNESKVLITAFQGDWSFHVSLINIQQKTSTKLSLPQPFLKWVNENEVAYLNWNNQSSSLYAPLIFYSLSNGEEQSIFTKVFQFNAYKNLLMTTTVNEKEQTKAEYTFFDSKLKSFFSFKIPQLTKDSAWLVPFSDYNERNFQFITFRPLDSTSAATYSEGFQLAEYNLVNGKSAVLLKGLENEPLSISPSGNYCLYGNQFEKIIDLRAKKIVELVKE